ncbi:hypothetical protein UUU_19870 [Klebsiella pneumoniae subsp. pneumoniae DSM 30104 = JCM 1662 = NBRC 14940]|nr:hypothetical protein UUU_19870 [Klebsiella pneumoniae subsp. pneumoniae DSM 30104 = JCM 1662 = NBRC 14940]
MAGSERFLFLVLNVSNPHRTRRKMMIIFSTIRWFTKRDSGLLTVTGRIDKPPGCSHH